MNVRDSPGKLVILRDVRPVRYQGSHPDAKGEECLSQCHQYRVAGNLGEVGPEEEFHPFAGSRKSQCLDTHYYQNDK